MKRRAIHVAIALAAPLSLAPTIAPPPRAAEPGPALAAALDPDGDAATCKHFANRARFRDRGVAPDFLVTAADACAEALADDSPEAATLLSRLTRLRLTIREMNLTRAYGADPAPQALPIADLRGASRRAGRIGDPVSGAGEYLIAREIGVLRALADWQAGQAPRTLARR